MRWSLWTGVGLSALLIVLVVPGVQAQSAAPRSITQAYYVEAYEARRDSLIRFYAYRFEAAEYGRGSYFDVAARLRLGIDEHGVLALLDSLLSRPDRRGCESASLAGAGR